MLTKYDKAIAAFVTFLGAFLAAHFGFELTPEVSSLISTAIGTVFTWLVPNKPATTDGN